MSLLAEFITTLEYFFNATKDFPTKNSAFEFLQSIPPWEPNMYNGDSKQCISGVPFLHWNAAEKTKITTHFKRLIDIDSRPTLNELITFACEVNDLRCMFIVMWATHSSNKYRARSQLKQLQLTLLACCGWSV